MKVSSIDVVKQPSSTKVLISTDQFAELYFCYSRSISTANVGELALLSLLVPAMLIGGVFSLPQQYKICPKLLEQLHSFQDIFCVWFPKLKKVDIVCAQKTSTDYGSSDIDGLAFFSGGLDSFYTYYQERESTNLLMHCQGMDIRLSEKQRIHEAEMQCKDFARKNLVDLLLVETNFRDVINTTDGVITHGLVLIGMALPVCSKTIFVPGTHTLLELEPWGSHPLTDPLLATAGTKVIHHGPQRRSTKLRALEDNQEVLDMLRVCNSSDKYNCCECEKCLRTMFALEVLGKSSKALKRITGKQLKQLRIYNESEAGYWRDNRLLAKEAAKTNLYRAADSIISRFEFKQLIKSLIFRRS
jgi:hypothetical protein